MLSFTEARSRLLSDVEPTAAERVPLSRAPGRVLAETLRAPRPLPPADLSAMDGWAFASADLPGSGPWTLPWRGESRTGSAPPAWERGAACRIFTGAALPAGTDTVVPQEDVRAAADSITLEKPVRPGANVRRAGEDLAAGAAALERGARLHPGHLALAAMIGRADLAVARAPVVAVLCTGDELRRPGEMVDNSSIYESNGVMLCAMAEQAGARARLLLPVVDDEASTVRAVAEGLDGADLLVTVGGVSVGDHDVVRAAFAKAGVELDFWKVAMKPGRPLAVGRRERARVLGLPGNPASALVTFALFGQPLLRAMQGDAQPLPLPVRARLADPVTRDASRPEFARARLEAGMGELVVRLHRNQSSGAATSLAWSDALAVLPAGASRLEAGELIETIRLSDC